MSLNQLINPIDNGLDVVLKSLQINEGFVLTCTDQSQIYFVPPTSGNDGDLLSSTGSGNIQFISQQSLPTKGLFMTTSNATLFTGLVARSLLQGASFIGSLTVPSNGFQISAYHFNISGQFNSVNGTQITINLRTDGIVLGNITVPLVSTTGQFFEIECDFSIRSLGAAGVASIVTNFDFTYSDTGTAGFKGSRSVSINNTTFNTNISNTLSVTALFDSANASNNMTVNQAILNQVY